MVNTVGGQKSSLVITALELRSAPSSRRYNMLGREAPDDVTPAAGEETARKSRCPAADPRPTASTAAQTSAAGQRRAAGRPGTPGRAVTAPVWRRVIVLS